MRHEPRLTQGNTRWRNWPMFRMRREATLVPWSQRDEGRARHESPGRWGMVLEKQDVDRIGTVAFHLIGIGRPLVDGESFTLTVDRVVQTYAGIPADVDLTMTLEPINATVIC
jgi:hypothetical protein